MEVKIKIILIPRIKACRRGTKKYLKIFKIIEIIS
jgi:hypothetical protein